MQLPKGTLLGPGFRFPRFSQRFTKQCPSPEAGLPLKPASGGEIKAAEWMGPSAWPQTPARPPGVAQ